MQGIGTRAVKIRETLAPGEKITKVVQNVSIGSGGNVDATVLATFAVNGRGPCPFEDSYTVYSL